MRSGMLVGVLALLSGCELCKPYCPSKLTLVLSDAAGRPLTPKAVVEHEGQPDAGPDVTHACGEANATCAENRLTFDAADRAPRVRVEATTGEVFEGSLSPAWSKTGTSGDLTCPCDLWTATAELTLR